MRGLRQALHFFAPHQPRLDHHLFYEAFEIDLQLTAQSNPYFCASALMLPRLAQRIIEGSAGVLALLRVLPTAEEIARGEGNAPEGCLSRGATHVRMLRTWARFALPEERARTGAVWVDCDQPSSTYGAASVVDHFAAVRGEAPARMGRERPSTQLPPFTELPRLEGAWQSLAHAMAQQQLMRDCAPPGLGGAGGGGGAGAWAGSDVVHESDAEGAVVQHSFFYVPRRS